MATSKLAAPLALLLLALAANAAEEKPAALTSEQASAPSFGERQAPRGLRSCLLDRILIILTDGCLQKNAWCRELLPLLGEPQTLDLILGTGARRAAATVRSWGPCLMLQCILQAEQLAGVWTMDSSTRLYGADYDDLLKTAAANGTIDPAQASGSCGSSQLPSTPALT